MEITICGKCGLKYPKKMKQCPRCDGPTAKRPLTPAEHIAQLNDTEVEYIFQNSWWTQGTKESRELCLAEYDKRFGLGNWPAHINREA